MRLVELPAVYVVMLGLHESLRTLGYPSKNIFVGQQDGVLVVSVQEDGKYAAFAAGAAIPGWDEVWGDVARQWNNTTDDDRLEMLNLFRANMSATKLVMSLMGRGIYPRKTSAE